MILTKYSVEEQKAIVRRWNHYYGRGIRTLSDIEHFEELVENRLDDLLRLVALEVTTDFHQCFEGWNPKDSLCNLVYKLSIADAREGSNKVNEFLDDVTDFFKQVPFEKSREEVIETALDFISQEMNKNREPRPESGTVHM